MASAVSSATWVLGLRKENGTNANRLTAIVKRAPTVAARSVRVLGRRAMAFDCGRGGVHAPSAAEQAGTWPVAQWQSRGLLTLVSEVRSLLGPRLTGRRPFPSFRRESDTC